MGDNASPRDTLSGLAQLAADLGPVLRPRRDDEFLQAIVESARLVFDAAACSIALFDEAEEMLEFRVAAGSGAAATIGIRIPADRGIAGWALMSGQAIAVDNVRQDPRFAADVAETTGYVPNAIMAMPLESERHTFGVIEVLDRRRAGGEGVDDMEILALFARQATSPWKRRASSRTSAARCSRLPRSPRRASDLRRALAERAAAAPKPQTELAELALLFHELGDGAG